MHDVGAIGWLIDRRTWRRRRWSTARRRSVQCRSASPSAASRSSSSSSPASSSCVGAERRDATGSAAPPAHLLACPSTRPRRPRNGTSPRCRWPATRTRPTSTSSRRQPAPEEEGTALLETDVTLPRACVCVCLCVRTYVDVKAMTHSLQIAAENRHRVIPAPIFRTDCFVLFKSRNWYQKKICYSYSVFRTWQLGVLPTLGWTVDICIIGLRITRSYQLSATSAKLCTQVPRFYTFFTIIHTKHVREISIAFW